MKDQIDDILDLYFCNDEVTTQECRDRLLILFEESRVNKNEVLFSFENETQAKNFMACMSDGGLEQQYFDLKDFDHDVVNSFEYDFNKQIIKGKNI